MSASNSSLVARLSRSLSLWVGGFWLITAVGIAYYVYHEIEESLDASLVESAHRLLDLVVHEVDEMDAPALSSASPTKEVADSQTPKVEKSYLTYQVMNRADNIVLRSAGAPSAPLVRNLTTGFAQSQDWRTYTLRHSARELYIVVADSAAHRSAAIGETLQWLLLPLALLLPLLMLAVRRVTTVELRSVQKITTEISARSGTNLTPISVLGLPKELHAISDSTNHLLSRLEDALKIERALAANAAHELRTPLAAARLSLSTALAFDMSPEARDATEQIAHSLKTLERRTEKILQLSRAEGGAALNHEVFNLGVLTTAVVQEFNQISSTGSRIKLCLPDNDTDSLLGDLDSLAIAIRNLIENSLKYAPESDVFVTVSGAATVTVSDTGAGVSADDLERLQTRHVRAATNQAGFGLGLSIVRTVIEKQGGRLVLHSPPTGQPHGFEAILVLGQ
jgi:two-component system, OmpR family, sensor kinase